MFKRSSVQSCRKTGSTVDGNHDRLRVSPDTLQIPRSPFLLSLVSLPFPVVCVRVCSIPQTLSTNRRLRVRLCESLPLANISRDVKWYPKMTCVRVTEQSYQIRSVAKCPIPYGSVKRRPLYSGCFFLLNMFQCVTTVYRTEISRLVRCNWSLLLFLSVHTPLITKTK